MGDEECLSRASIIETAILNANTGVELNNGQLTEEMQEDIDNVVKEDAVLWSPKMSLNNGLGRCDTEELFKNIPELKDIFQIKSKIGEGTFSNVYLAHYIEDPDELFAIKHITPTSAPDRVEREVRCLQEMGGKNNVIGYNGTLRTRDHSAVILPYFPHDKFQNYLQDMNVADIRDYMKNLLEALQHVHCFSIIHRDIKPGNFLHSRNLKRYNLVDFGLAMHEPGSGKTWDIEKKKLDENAKKALTKNVRLLSPASCKNSPNSKKSRTSPRVSIPSHKFTRQTSAIAKSSLKSSLKHGSYTSLNKQGDTKYSKEETCSKNAHQKTNGGGSSKLSSGLCETSHKKIDICSLCVGRCSQNAPRAGTSGFRAPEVLMKYPKQTTALDVWSAGVIMLCLLSGRYPFFRCYDDMTALAQLISLFGKQRVMDSSTHLGKYMVCKNNSTGFDLKTVCQKLRLCSGEKSRRHCSNECCKKCSTNKLTKIDKNEETSPGRSLRNTQTRTTSVSNSTSNGKPKARSFAIGHETAKTKEHSSDCVERDSIRQHMDGSLCICECGSCSRYLPRSAYDLLERCLDLNPTTRITAREALNHPFLTTTTTKTKIPPQPER